MKERKALITGAAGFIGYALSKHLINLGYEVTLVDRISVEISGTKSYNLDLTKSGILDPLINKETVLFHLAGSTSVSGSVENPKKDFDNNLSCLIGVLESVRKARCKLIFPSTASVYDSSNGLPLNEQDYVKPTSPYAAAKVAGEAYCAAYHRSFGLDIRVARLFSVYGIGMNRFAIYDIIKKIKKNNFEIELLGDGNQIRDYLYIDDLVNGLEVISSNGSPGEDYNLASGDKIKLIDLAYNISKIMGIKNLKVNPTGISFPGDVAKWYADISKINKIGFSPKISLDEGLLKTINWLDNNEE